MTPAVPIELNITSSAKCLPVVRGAVEKMANVEGFGEMDSHALTLAIDEALANVIEHGYEGKDDQPISITLLPVKSADGRPGISVTVRDKGRQVSPEKIKGRPLDEVRPGGLGVHIIKSVMDEVEYSCPPDGGMLLSMVKYVGGDTSAAFGGEPKEGQAGGLAQKGE